MSTNQTKLISILMQMGMPKNGRKDANGKPIRAALPGLLVGEPGIAKTDVVNHIARMIAEKSGQSFPIETYPTPQLNAEDMSGLPVPNREDKVTDLYPLRIGKQVIEAKRGCVFLDEISSAPASVGAAALTFIQNGQLGQTLLDPAVARMAAMNPAEIAAAGRELTAPESNRFCWIPWDLESADWVDWMRGGAGAAKEVVILPDNWEADYWNEAMQLVTSFIERHPTALHNCPQAHDASQAWNSPRSWTNSTRLMAACLSVGESHSSGLTTEAIEGCIGEDTATKFLTWVRELDLPDPEAILANPDKVKMPERADKLSVVCEAIVVASTREHPQRKQRAQVCYDILEELFETKSDMALPAIQQMVRRLPNRAERPNINIPAIKTAFAKMNIDLG